MKDWLLLTDTEAFVYGTVLGVAGVVVATFWMFGG